MWRRNSIALVLALFALFPPPARAETSTTYYVDASHGSDTASGRSPAAAWRSLDRVNATTFAAGDRVLLRAGRSWHGQLWPKGSGELGRPIVVGRYGRGAKPAVHGDGAVADAVRLFNQHHWVIRDLEVTNTAPPADVPGANLRDLRGIHVSSPAIDVGMTVPDNGGTDYTGRPYNGPPDIGAFERRD